MKILPWFGKRKELIRIQIIPCITQFPLKFFKKHSYMPMMTTWTNHHGLLVRGLLMLTPPTPPTTNELLMRLHTTETTLRGSQILSLMSVELSGTPHKVPDHSLMRARRRATTNGRACCEKKTTKADTWRIPIPN